MKVIIMGAGIGGLACAHELSKDPNNEIIILERWDTIGGLARIDRNTPSDTNYSEYCWKAISYSYKYLLNILSEINVLSNLRPLRLFKYKNKIEETNSFVSEIRLMGAGLISVGANLSDLVYLSGLYVYVNMLPKSVLKRYDSIAWYDYAKRLSEPTRRWLVDSTSIYLGMDYKKISTFTVFKFMRSSKAKSIIDSKYRFYSFNGPMDTQFLDIWKAHLVDAKVDIKFNCEIVAIDCRPNMQKSVSIINKVTEEKEIYESDVLVNALSVETLAKLLPQYAPLAINGTYTQCQVLFYIPCNYDHDKGIVHICAGSPWFIMARDEGSLWDIPHKLLSIGIGIWDVKGSNGKTAAECTREELATECWHQFCNEKTFTDTEQQIYNYYTSNMPKYNVWSTFVYDGEKLATVEPKFSNNINTYRYRPDIYEKKIDLYHAAAYVRTDMNIYNMESAAEAGVKAARAITKYELCTRR